MVIFVYISGHIDIPDHELEAQAGKPAIFRTEITFQKQGYVVYGRSLSFDYLIYE